MNEEAKTDAAAVLPKDYATIMSHFYRGELGRMMAWRERFDTTTHWAIIAVTGIVTFSWTSPGSNHFLFLLSNVILYLLLNIEARRYRFYDAYRARVRILEAHFIFPTVVQSPKMIQGDWRRALGADLLLPSFKITFGEALSRRFNRNYVWLFLITLLAWATQTALVSFRTENPESLLAGLRNELPFAPGYFFALTVTFYIYLTLLGILGFRARRASGEFQKRPNVETREWNI